MHLALAAAHDAQAAPHLAVTEADALARSSLREGREVVPSAADREEALPMGMSLGVREI
jgi:hypothetical protein